MLLTKYNCEIIISSQLLFSFFIFIFFLLFKFFLIKKEKINDKKSKILEIYLEEAMKQEDLSCLHSISFINLIKKISLLHLVNFIESFSHHNSMLPHPQWETVKDELLKIIKKHHAPLKWGSSLSSQLLAMRYIYLFRSCIQQEEKDLIKKALDSRFPIILTYAIYIIINTEEEALINLVIEKIAHNRRLNQETYLSHFHQENYVIGNSIIERLKNERDLYVRSVCYKILKRIKIFSEDVMIENDLLSFNADLKISALHYLAGLHPKKAVKVLILMLSDKDWEVRAAILKLLYQLNDKTNIEKVAHYLKDPSWWVRINAAAYLKNAGPQGINTLRAQSSEHDRYAHEAAQYTLRAKELGHVG